MRIENNIDELGESWSNTLLAAYFTVYGEVAVFELARMEDELNALPLVLKASASGERSIAPSAQIQCYSPYIVHFPCSLMLSRQKMKPGPGPKPLLNEHAS